MVNIHSVIPIEQFLQFALHIDREISQIPSTWEIERDEVYVIALRYYMSIGLYSVQPFAHFQTVRKDFIQFLFQSKEIKKRRLVVRREIEIAREKARIKGNS